MDKTLKTIEEQSKQKFRPVWNDSDRSAAFRLCNEIRQQVGLPAFDRAKFDNGWQHRNIFHKDYKVARDEFVNLVYGLW